jgi:glycosyltransferase involved in cell wall biosynthesis
MPSVREGFGMSVLEAQAAGAVPVVVRGPYTAAADLVTDAVDGRICDATPASLAAAIGELLEDDILRGRMSAATRRAAQRHDWDAIAASMVEVYGSVARSRPAMTEVKAA